MNIRGARNSDYDLVKELYTEYDFILDFKHLERLVIAEDDDGNIVAVSSLTTLLEGSFLTVRSASRRNRVEALRLLIAQAEVEVKALGYDSYHAFATNDQITRVLTKSFKFVHGKGLSLLKWLEGSD